MFDTISYYQFASNMQIPSWIKYSQIPSEEDGMNITTKQKPFYAKVLVLSLCFLVGSLGYFAAQGVTYLHLKNQDLHREYDTETICEQ